MDEITLALVQRAVAGERAAMEQIMRALERPFFNLAQRMLLLPAALLRPGRNELRIELKKRGAGSEFPLRVTRAELRTEV